MRKERMTQLIDKQDIIKEHQLSDKDTGSSEVQVALLTARIRHLTDHLASHCKDFHSRRGLIALSSRRKKLLRYIKKGSTEKYNELIKKLKIRG